MKFRKVEVNCAAKKKMTKLSLISVQIKLWISRILVDVMTHAELPHISGIFKFNIKKFMIFILVALNNTTYCNVKIIFCNSGTTKHRNNDYMNIFPSFLWFETIYHDLHSIFTKIIQFEDEFRIEKCLQDLFDL